MEEKKALPPQCRDLYAGRHMLEVIGYKTKEWTIQPFVIL